MIKTMNNTKFQLVKGFRDFYPPEMASRTWLFGKMRQVSRRFGYEEYEGPTLEPLALYAAKSGEELVKKQTFTLTDRSGEKLALRPELTPTLARMVAQKESELVKPLRWFSIGPRWRYEKPQKGRTREFYQWDVDLLGINSAEADAEIIALAAEFFKALNLTPKQVVIKVNDRRLMEQKLALIEIPSAKTALVIQAIDKKNKMAETDWQEYLQEIDLKPLQIKDLMGILKDRAFANESEELTALFSTLKDLGVADYVEFDPTVVRGLDYYTGTVLEAVDRGGEFRTILGGGRYDNLVETVGGQPLGGVGFACGDKVIEEVLLKYNQWPSLKSIPTQVLVTLFDESFYRQSLALVSELRKKGFCAELYLTPEKLDKQLKYADKKGIPWAVIIGPDEAEKGLVTLKNLVKKTQKTIPQTALLSELKL
jgi:histidyl-tRNA synthetase